MCTCSTNPSLARDRNHTRKLIVTPDENVLSIPQVRRTLLRDEQIRCISPPSVEEEEDIFPTVFFFLHLLRCLQIGTRTKFGREAKIYCACKCNEWFSRTGALPRSEWPLALLAALSVYVTAANGSMSNLWSFRVRLIPCMSTTGKFRVSWEAFLATVWHLISQSYAGLFAQWSLWTTNVWQLLI